MGGRRQVKSRATVQGTGRLSTMSGSSMSPEDLRKGQLAKQVFGNELLREIILEYAILKKGPELDRNVVCCLRIVGKDWCRTISEICYKKGQPLYKLILDKDNSVQDTEYVRNNGKLLDQFFKSVHSNNINGICPTFSLKILEEFFRQENYTSLTTCFVNQGAKLIGLEMVVPVDVGSLKCVFPHFNFPALRKLTFNLTTVNLFNIGNPRAPSDNLTHLLNSLLNGAVALQEFIIPLATVSVQPPDFRCLNLPTCLTRIELGCASLTSQNLGVLAKTKFPNLTHLKLVVAGNPKGNEGLFVIFENVRKSLRLLILTGQSYLATTQNLSRLRFPVMEKLKEFCNSSPNLELEPGSGNLKYLPKLIYLALLHQTVPMLRKWTDNSVYPTMQHLSLLLVNENAVNAAQDDYWISINLEIMQSVHISFPNLCILHLYMNSGETCGLKYVFMEMTQLISLKVEVKTDVTGPDFWDALLIGAPLEFVAGLRMNPNFWEQVQLNNEGRSSIKSLTELRTFSLYQKKTAGSPARSTDTSLISDLTFHFALMKMPKLKSLFLSGKFMVSQEMSEKWKGQGRQVCYSA